jgi:glutamate-ammonia-ligase adenylyltransferase
VSVLADLIREGPRPPRAHRTRAVSARLGERADAPTRERLAASLAGRPHLAPFLAGAFEGSPFLFDLAGRDPGRLLAILESDPDRRLADLLARVAVEEPAAADDAEAMRVLRLARQELALLVGLADLGGAWDLARVTGALTSFAEACLRAALRRAFAREAERGRLEGGPPEESGYFVLGMGKLGAGELNYSSDVDLIAFYDRDRTKLRDPDEHQAVFVRVTQHLARLLSEKTYDGFVFRVDLRLRPDPGTYPVAISTMLAENYYEAVGQNWERAAFIKARPVAGDLACGERFLRTIRPFVFRKYLDFAAVAEVHAMKREIHAAKGHAAVAVAGHDLKLGRGGIREIEFFAQTQQLIGGGRDPRLRGRDTLGALAALREAGWIDAAALGGLSDAYVELRRLEHRLQMVADAQTHTLPSDPEALRAFARLAGFASAAAMTKAVSRVLSTVERHYARLFEGEADDAPALRISGAAPDPATVEALGRMGFAEPMSALDTIRGWLSGRMAATRTQAARERLVELLPAFLTALAAAGQPDVGLAAFDRFLGRLPAGVQLFSLLRSNPDLLRLLASLVAAAPRLTAMLARRPRVVEGLIEHFHARSDGTSEGFGSRLAVALAEASSYEDALDRARVFTQEQMFLIGVRVLSGEIEPADAGAVHARLADAVVAELHRRVGEEHARRHGRTPRDASAIVAMGKFGSAEMTAVSDLDLILLYADRHDALSDGPKPLYASEYYTRLTQRLVAALSAPTAEGVVYAVDFRLRPSGNKGPLATSLDAFLSYQESEAWTWEHMALTRARVVAGPAAFAENVEGKLAAILRRRRDPAKLLADILEMRATLAREKPPADAWDVKLLPGGLVDVEFLAQWLVLGHAHARPALAKRDARGVFEAAVAEGVLDRETGAALIAATRFHHGLTQAMRLALDDPLDVRKAPAALRGFLARAVGAADMGRVRSELERTCERVLAAQRRLWGAAPSRDQAAADGAGSAPGSRS